MYVYFEFGYEGGYTLLIGLGYGIISTLFTATYPWLSKKFGRNKILYSAGIATIFGFALMLILPLQSPLARRNLRNGLQNLSLLRLHIPSSATARVSI